MVHAVLLEKPTVSKNIPMQIQVREDIVEIAKEMAFEKGLKTPNLAIASVYTEVALAWKRRKQSHGNPGIDIDSALDNLDS